MPREIMIVDDESDLRNAVAAILRPQFQVLEACGGAAAMSVLKERRPFLMLLDVSMPGMSGLEALAAAKAFDPALIVVMLSSQREIETARRCLDLGASEYITKPFDAEYLRAEIRRLAAPARPRDEDRPPWTVKP